MKNRKMHLAMFAVAGLATPAAVEGVASADIASPTVTKLLGPSTNDLAPTTGNPPRLKRTDEEQPGAEMSHLAFFGDGTAANPHTAGLYFEMRSGEINGALPPNKIQLAMVPFHLALQPDGTVAAVADMTGAKFVTKNNGNEHRNANHPAAITIAAGNAVCAEYNYQPNNDTKRYIQCWNKAGANILAQTQIYAKNNDDCSMSQDSTSTTVVRQSVVAGKSVTKLVAWRGCNGNGQDDGWLQAFSIEATLDANGVPTAATFKPQMDVSLAQREERSRGLCSVSAADPNTAICSWTEGNNQPQRDGTWLAAVNISDNITGTDKQNAILWKQQIDGRKGQGDLRTYSVRAKTERIMVPNATTGVLEASDMLIWQSGDLHGSNNNNNGKGGTYFDSQMAVIKATKTGLTYVAPLQSVQKLLLGLDGTHLGMGVAMFGTSDKMVPGITFVGGSQTGGGYSAKVRAVAFDQTANAFKDLGSYSIAPYDRHLYPNYLGNNPGNQGRNFSGAQLIPNPFAGQMSTGATPTLNKDAYLTVYTTTGKDPMDINNAALKLSSYITVLPTVQMPAQTGTGTGSGSGSGSGSGTGTGTGSGSGSGSGTTTPTDPAPMDPGTNLGGCSTSGGTSGAMTFLLIGLAAFIRRRK
jgi:uncharacterized protein (TIGR03382 family)